MPSHHKLDLRRRGVRLLVPLFYLLAVAPAGCASAGGWNLFASSPPPTASVDTLVLHGDHLEPEHWTGDPKSLEQLAGAKELYRGEQYDKAGKAFHRLAENKKNTELIAEEARFYEAESLYRQKRYPKAADTYARLLTDFPSGAHREPSMRRMFDIANYWLDDTREDMRRDHEKRDGKHWIAWPTACVHFEKSKPLLDETGRAEEKLEQVVYNDVTGPLAPEAMFLLASVKFYHEDYREADHYFSQLVQMHPNSKYAPRAVELAIISKHLSTGGSDYDGRKTAEARQLVYQAQERYPEFSREKVDFLGRQLHGITMQQAEKDFKIAEFYRRTDHPGAAYFCYDVVRRRYPTSPFAGKSIERMQELQAQHPGVVQASVPASRPATPGKPETAPMPRSLPSQPGQPELAPPPRPVPTPVPPPDYLKK